MNQDCESSMGSSWRFLNGKNIDSAGRGSHILSAISFHCVNNQQQTSSHSIISLSTLSLPFGHTFGLKSSIDQKCSKFTRYAPKYNFPKYSSGSFAEFNFMMIMMTFVFTEMGESVGQFLGYCWSQQWNIITINTQCDHCSQENRWRNRLFGGWFTGGISCCRAEQSWWCIKSIGCPTRFAQRIPSRKTHPVNSFSTETI